MFTFLKLRKLKRRGIRDSELEYIKGVPFVRLGPLNSLKTTYLLCCRTFNSHQWRFTRCIKVWRWWRTRRGGITAFPIQGTLEFMVFIWFKSHTKKILYKKLIFTCTPASLTKMLHLGGSKSFKFWLLSADQNAFGIVSIAAILPVYKFISLWPKFEFLWNKENF